MPDSPAQEMDTSVTAWIAAFNKAKGWKTLKGSSANRPDAENLRVSPKRQLREDGKKALAGMTKDELTAEISFDEGRLAEVKAEIATPTAESDVAALRSASQWRCSTVSRRCNISAPILLPKATVPRISSRRARRYLTLNCVF